MLKMFPTFGSYSFLHNSTKLTRMKHIRTKFSSQEIKIGRRLVNPLMQTHTKINQYSIMNDPNTLSVCWQFTFLLSWFNTQLNFK